MTINDDIDKIAEALGNDWSDETPAMYDGNAEAWDRIVARVVSLTEALASLYNVCEYNKVLDPRDVRMTSARAALADVGEGTPETKRDSLTLAEMNAVVEQAYPVAERPETE
jgi:hypothetical protein